MLGRASSRWLLFLNGDGRTDAKGVRRVLGGNPQTGPFYVEGAMPGDTLVVRLVRVRLNRDWAISDDGIVPRGMDADLAVKMKDAGASVRWHLDLAKGVATSEKPGEHLAKYTVLLRPMLGCVAVAPGPAAAPSPTGDSGGWGGNMDFNEIVEGATVYLTVRNPGALLYFGDAHAAQGDGELTGNALETSMDVQLTVDLIRDKSIPGPRLEVARTAARGAWLRGRRERGANRPLGHAASRGQVVKLRLGHRKRQSISRAKVRPPRAAKEDIGTARSSLVRILGPVRATDGGPPFARATATLGCCSTDGAVAGRNDLVLACDPSCTNARRIVVSKPAGCTSGMVRAAHAGGLGCACTSAGRARRRSPRRRQFRR